MFFVLDFPGTIHPIDHNLVVPKTSKRRCVSDGHATLQGSLSSRGLFERSTGASQAHEDSGGFQVQHDMPRMLKPFRQCQPLSPCVTGLQLMYLGVTQETLKRAFPIVLLR